MPTCKMMQTTILAVIALAAIAPSKGDTTPPITESVSLTVFDASSNTYSGQVSINSAPCPNSAYSISLSVSHVKDEQEAREQVKETVKKITDDIRAAAAHCGAH